MKMSSARRGRITRKILTLICLLGLLVPFLPVLGASDTTAAAGQSRFGGVGRFAQNADGGLTVDVINESENY